MPFDKRVSKVLEEFDSLRVDAEYATKFPKRDYAPDAGPINTEELSLHVLVEAVGAIEDVLKKYRDHFQPLRIERPNVALAAFFATALKAMEARDLVVLEGLGLGPTVTAIRLASVPLAGVGLAGPCEDLSEVDGPRLARAEAILRFLRLAESDRDLITVQDRPRVEAAISEASAAVDGEAFSYRLGGILFAEKRTKTVREGCAAFQKRGGDWHGLLRTTALIYAHGCIGLLSEIEGRKETPETKLNRAGHAAEVLILASGMLSRLQRGSEAHLHLKRVLLSVGLEGA